MNEKKVYLAIVKAMGLIAKEGISKGRKNQQQGYNFRGIDDVYNALAPILSDCQLCILPRVLSRELIERESAKGNALFYVTLAVEFDIVSAEDGSMHTVKTYGEAMDSADKATNKAMSAAYKYMAMEVFCIPTEGDNDADATTHEVRPPANTAREVAGDEFRALTPDMQTWICDLAGEVEALMAKEGPEQAYQHVEENKLDNDAKMALWYKLESKTRAALKKCAREKNGTPKATGN